MKQISRLPSAIHHFWIDTLCVPVAKPYRRLAISRVRETFGKASAVLVLDQELLKLGRNLQERVYRLLLSDWQQRLWTVQESLLAGKRLYIAYADEVVDLHQMVEDLDFTNYVPYILFDYSVRESLLSRFLIRPLEAADRLLMIARNFHLRQTTKAEDEPGCLATLMGIDPLKLPDRSNVADVLALLHTFPQKIMFALGPRSKTKGMRWAVTTLLAREQAQVYTVVGNQPEAIVTPRGVRVFLHGIWLDDSFWFEPLCEKVGDFWNVVVSDANDRRICVLGYDQTMDDVAEQGRSRPIEKPALIFEKGLEIDPPWSLALLVSHAVVEDGVIYCSFEAIVIAVEPEEYSASNQIDESTSVSLRGSWLDHCQGCID